MRFTRIAEDNEVVGQLRESLLMTEANDEKLSRFSLLFLAELLESGIGAQRVPDRIEPKKGRRESRGP